MEMEEQHQQPHHQDQTKLINYWGNTPEDEYYSLQGIKGTKSSYSPPNRGLTLFTRSWLPLTHPPIALLLMVHGFGNDISWTFQSTPIFLARHGFACFALDLQGHGHSQGLKGYVPDVDAVVDDCLSFFHSILDRDHQFRDLPKFLYGESMGGAICLLIHFRSPPNLFDGAVLVVPMCKISDEIKPRWPIPQILTFLAKFAPTLPIVPAADLLEKSVKVPEKKVIAAMNPTRYQGKPRLKTVSELFRVTDFVNGRLREVTLPFIVLHGDADLVTDPNVSRELYESAKSEDKSIRIYGGMMHSLLFGEPDENVELVRRDILNWLNDHCS